MTCMFQIAYGWGPCSDTNQDNKAQCRTLLPVDHGIMVMHHPMRNSQRI
jgi:hypothetical protein